MALSNDARGWILSCISGVACVLGALVIYVDVLVRLLPGKSNFRIQDSSAFLSCSLGLSAGVMLFSALYKMLPSSKEYLEVGGYTAKQASWILIASFLAGVWGIQLLSRILHQFMPTHVVGCHHTHDDEDPEELKVDANAHRHPRHQHGRPHVHHSGHEHVDGDTHDHTANSETSPLLSKSNQSRGKSLPRQVAMRESRETSTVEVGTRSRPSLPSRVTQLAEFFSVNSFACDEHGPCKGFSDPCGTECFKKLSARALGRVPQESKPPLVQRHSVVSTLSRTSQTLAGTEDWSQSHHDHPRSASDSDMPPPPNRSTSPSNSSTSTSTPTQGPPLLPQRSELTAADSTPHHHHVPQNAFLSLSLQTSIAIALHKIPEGFITFATNHANPNLGFAVFLALAIHNVSEGFVLALPLFLATNSHLRACLLSVVLGGLSQPLGAGIASLWFHVAERRRGEDGFEPNQAVYGGMFAVTAGIMASVSLSLLQQSFELSHNKGLCVFFVFVGMGVLGVAAALTA